ncbi:hypothetical protein BT96DRAFT_992950 [Gymnopus androsaceus JB14]|uniref:Uncharacterized protein n=1 Tax=Gymnopus androsaceus JB14 TaxID=1447944 RepID=A0A6A4HTZ8_9AGAR|nr:hypothetical protein BT96DRAFT_992950 [Gymnopus androsaceus JB14]
MATVGYSIYSIEPASCVVSFDHLVFDPGVFIKDVIATIVAKHLQKEEEGNLEIEKARDSGTITSMFQRFPLSSYAIDGVLQVYLLIPRKSFQNIDMDYYRYQTTRVQSATITMRRTSNSTEAALGPDLDYPQEKEQALKFLQDLLTPRWINEKDHQRISSLLPPNVNNTYTTSDGDFPEGLGQNDSSINAESYSYIHLLSPPCSTHADVYKDGGREATIASYFISVNAALKKCDYCSADLQPTITFSTQSWLYLLPKKSSDCSLMQRGYQLLALIETYSANGDDRFRMFLQGASMVQLISIAPQASMDLYILPCIYNDLNMKTTMYGLYLSKSGWVRSVDIELDLIEMKDALSYLTLLYNISDHNPTGMTFYQMLRRKL